MIATLPPRLQAIASQVMPGEPMADIGTDHALLPAHLVGHGLIPDAIAIDCRPGPLAAASRTLSREGITGVALRLGDGLAALHEPVATIVIAGMGGHRIRSILEGAPVRVRGAKRLVLQPNTEWPLVRRTVATAGWQLLGEQMVEDAGKFYLILTVRPCPGRPWRLDDRQALLGLQLPGRADPVYRRWLEHERDRRRSALARSAAARDPADPARHRLQRELQLLQAG